MASKSDLTMYFKQAIEGKKGEKKHKAADEFILQILEYEDFDEIAKIYKKIIK